MVAATCGFPVLAGQTYRRRDRSRRFTTPRAPFGAPTGSPPPLLSNPMATIEHRGDSVRVNWRLGGTREGARQSCTFRGTPKARLKLAEAAKVLAESRSHNLTRDECYTAILGTSPEGPTVVPTFKQWVEMWITDRKRMRDIQPDVIRQYHRALTSRVVPFLGHLRLTDINPDILRDWVGWMSSSRITQGSKNRRTGDRLLSAQTIRRTHAITHACLGAAVPRWLPANPAARPAGARRHTTGLPKAEPFEGMFLTRHEIDLILDKCRPEIRDMVFAAVRTGMRLGELCALEARHVVFSPTGATILVRKALKNDGTVGPPKSAKSRRDVTVKKNVADVLAERVRGKRPGALVFPSPSGIMWCENNFRERFWLTAVAEARRCAEHPPPMPPKPTRGPRRKLRKDEVSTCDCPTRLHRRPRFHDVRHTHASLLIAAGWSAKKVQMRLGHASYTTTMNVYGHLFDLGDESELDGVEELLEGPPTPRPRRGGSGLRPVRRVVSPRLLVRR